MLRRLFGVVAALTCLGCEGVITATSGAMTGGAGASPVAFALPSCDPSAAPAPQELLRLTKPELSATLRERVGATVHGALAPRLAQLPDEDPSRGLGQFANGYTQLHLEVQLDLAMDAADRLTATDAV